MGQGEGAKMNAPHVLTGKNQLTIRAELFGSDCGIGFGLTARGAAPVLALCRKLLAAGHNPALALEAYRGGTLCLRVRSIGEGARLRVATHGVGFERMAECTEGPPARQSAIEVSDPPQARTAS
jgi:hypothetical protein